MSLTLHAMSLTLAYCAGVIDSDGTIGIKRLTYNMRVRGDATAPIYKVRICVRQVEHHAVELLKETFGGTIRVNKGQGNGRNLFQWEVTDRIAGAALKDLIPYLRIKQRQAQNGLAMRALVEESKRARGRPGRGHQGAAARPEILNSQMQLLFNHAKTLNLVGQPK